MVKREGSYCSSVAALVRREWWKGGVGMNDDIKAMASSITHHFASLWARTDRTTFSEHQLTVRHWGTDFNWRRFLFLRRAGIVSPNINWQSDTGFYPLWKYSINESINFERNYNCIVAEGDFCFYGEQAWSPPTSVIFMVFYYPPLLQHLLC